jgi:hypothetical protein
LSKARSIFLARQLEAARMRDDPEAKAKQHAKFVETARALGCDEDEAAFDENLKKLVPPRPKPATQTSAKKGEIKDG